MRRLKLTSLIIFSLLLLGLWFNSSSWFRFKLARFYEQEENQAEVIKIYEKILRKSEIETKHPLAFIFKQKLPVTQRYDLANKLADYYFKSGNKKGAIDCYKILKEINPEKIGDYLNLYALTCDIDLLLNAILDNKDLRDKLSFEYRNTPFYKFYYGLELIKRKRYDEAKDEFSQLVYKYYYLSTFHH